MPKIFNTSQELDDMEFEGTSGFDVCRICWPKVQKNPEKYFDKLKPYGQDMKHGSEPQGTHYRTEGVPMMHGDGERCEVCDAILTERDEEE